MNVGWQVQHASVFTRAFTRWSVEPTDDIHSCSHVCTRVFTRVFTREEGAHLETGAGHVAPVAAANGEAL
jgi:hypothetical protein